MIAKVAKNEKMRINAKKGMDQESERSQSANEESSYMQFLHPSQEVDYRMNQLRDDERSFGADSSLISNDLLIRQQRIDDEMQLSLIHI